MNITDPIFHDEAKATAHIEAQRWGGEPVCPHCGSLHVTRMGGKTQAGMFLCNDCRDKFTVRTGTVMERSHVPLHKWLLATHIMAASKKGMSASQMARMLGVTYKTAWFMFHRLREAMRDGALAPMGGLDGPAGGAGIVEADETFIGREPGEPITKGVNHKMKVLSLVDRSSGAKRSFVLDFINVKAITEIVTANVSREAILMTDEASYYVKLGTRFAGHGHTNHAAGEYVSRFNPLVHTNTVEGSFAIFKRGMRGVYQHCDKRHLHRYLAEFDFRYSNRVALGVNDVARTDTLLAGVVGKRLTYQTARGAH